MKVSEFVQQLQDHCDPDWEVALASDPEGNDFRLVTDVGWGYAEDLDLSVPGFSAVETKVAVIWPW